MRPSPIHLNSSKQAKLRVSRSKSANHNDSSIFIKENSKLNQSIHTIKIKKSPNKIIHPQIYPKNSQPFRSQTLTTFITKTVKPEENRSPFKTMNPLTNSRGTKSFYQLPKPHGIIIHPQVKRLSHQKQNKKLSPFHKDLTQTFPNNNPIKAIQQNQQSFIKIVELGKSRSPIKVIHPPIKMISPPKIIKQVVYKPTPKQIQLQRKVKILEMRIGELHNEKNLIETKMNEMNIRLQYENNFLRQKLNKIPSDKNIRPFNNIDSLIKTVSSEEVKPNNDLETHQLHTSCPQKINPILLEVVPKSTQKLSKSSDGFYQKSKQIQSIKQQLLETQEMLSKQIEKSLKLLQQLSFKQKENEQMKAQIKVLNEKLQQKDQKYFEFQSQHKKLEQKLVSLESRFKEITVQILSKNAYISGLQEKIIDSNNQQSDNKVPKELYDEMQQNNQILMSAMSSLQKSVNESQNQIATLNIQKEQLQEQVSRLQAQLQEKRTKLAQRQEGNEFWRQKVDETQLQIRDSHNKLQTFQLLIEEKNQVIGEKERQLLQKQIMIQNLQERIQQLESNTLQSQNGCRKPQRNVCTKCGQLRRTVIRLNSYLNNCSNQFSREAKGN